MCKKLISRALLPILMGVMSLSCTDLGVEAGNIDDPNFEVSLNKSLEEVKKYIIGEWEWYKSISWAFESQKQTTTPESEGYTRRMIFQSRGRVEIYRNDSLQQEGSYYVSEVPGGYYNLMISYYSNDYDLRVNDKYLSTDNRPADGEATYYVRKK